MYARELGQVGRFAKANLLGFFFCGFNRPPVSKYTAYHPKSADAYGSRAVNEHRAIRGIIQDLQELGCLFFLGFAVYNRDVEVLEAQLFCLRLFFVGPMLTRSAKVEDHLDPFGL